MQVSEEERGEPFSFIMCMYSSRVCVYDAVYVLCVMKKEGKEREM